METHSVDFSFLDYRHGGEFVCRYAHRDNKRQSNTQYGALHTRQLYVRLGRSASPAAHAQRQLGLPLLLPDPVVGPNLSGHAVGGWALNSAEFRRILSAPGLRQLLVTPASSIARHSSERNQFRCLKHTSTCLESKEYICVLLQTKTKRYSSLIPSSLVSPNSQHIAEKKKKKAGKEIGEVRTLVPP